MAGMMRKKGMKMDMSKPKDMSVGMMGKKMSKDATMGDITKDMSMGKKMAMKKMKRK